MAKCIAEIEDDKIVSAVGLVECKNCLYASRVYGNRIVCTLNWKEKKEGGYCDEAVLDRSDE